jgi:CheY-like chemotaxis protein
MNMSNTTRLKTVLLVDDDDDIRNLTECFLQSFGYAVVCAASPREALAVFDPQAHALVVTDNSMPGMTGAEMARLMKLRSPATPILMYTGLVPPDCPSVDGLLQRPVDMEELRSTVDRLLAEG